MNSFRVQLQLCDFTNKNRTEYPKSIVLSELLIEGKFFFGYGVDSAKSI
jgi:hypothetical protein